MSFFTKVELQEIENAIAEAELNTSGEVVLFLCKKSKGDIYEYGKKIFNKNKLYETEQRNGVLIVLAHEDHKIAVLGDEGINNLTGQDFWDDVIELIIENFKVGQFKEGLCKGISLIGEKLKEFYPYQKDDVNELKNEILHED